MVTAQLPSLSPKLELYPARPHRGLIPAKAQVRPRGAVPRPQTMRFAWPFSRKHALLRAFRLHHKSPVGVLSGLTHLFVQDFLPEAWLRSRLVWLPRGRRDDRTMLDAYSRKGDDSLLSSEFSGAQASSEHRLKLCSSPQSQFRAVRYCSDIGSLADFVFFFRLVTLWPDSFPLLNQLTNAPTTSTRSPTAPRPSGGLDARDASERWSSRESSRRFRVRCWRYACTSRPQLVPNKLK